MAGAGQGSFLRVIIFLVYNSYFKKIVGNLKLSGICLDFGCGVARHTILMEEFGIESHGLDVSDSAIKKGQENCKSFGLEKLAGRLNVIKDHKILFEDNFFDFILIVDI